MQRLHTEFKITENTTPFQSVSSSFSIQLNGECSTPESAMEALVKQAFGYWTGRATKDLIGVKKLACLSHLEFQIKEIFQTLSFMVTAAYSSEQISLVSFNLLSLVHMSMDNFIIENKTYEQNKIEVIQNLRRFEDKIKKENISIAPFNPGDFSLSKPLSIQKAAPTKLSDLSVYELLVSLKQMLKIMETALLARSLEAVAWVPNQVIDLGFKMLSGASELTIQAVKAACHASSNINKMCDVAASTYHTAIAPVEYLFTILSKFYQDAIDPTAQYVLTGWRNQNKQDLETETLLNMSYGISSEKTHHYYADRDIVYSELATVGISIAVAPLVKPLSKVIQKFKKPLPSLDEEFILHKDKFLKAFLDVEDLSDQGKAIWKRAQNPNSTHYIEFQRDKIAIDGRRVGKVIEGNNSYVIKSGWESTDILCEQEGIRFLESLKLKHLELPQVVALGKDRSSSEFFIAKTYIEGETFGEMMKSIGQMSFSSPRRAKLMEEFKEGSRHLGLAMKELQDKGLHFPQYSHIEDLIETHIYYQMVSIECLNDWLSKVRFPTIRANDKYLNNLANGFKKDPGKLSYGFLDFNNGQFTWSKERASLAFIDAEYIPSTIDTAKRPLLFPSKEYYSLMEQYQSGGFIDGLTNSEIRDLQRSFQIGYNAQSAGNLSEGSKKFFEFQYHVGNIQNLAEKYAEEVKGNIIKDYIHDINRKIMLN